MKGKVIYSVIVLLALVLLGGCRAKKGVVKRDTKRTHSDEMIKNITNGEIDYNTIEIKSSTRAELDGRNYSLNITYRNKKNETIWVSVRAMLGIEAARLIANRDSVWLVSRLAHTKEKGSWKEMSKMLGYPLDFMAFQSIMSRKLFYPGNEDLNVLKDFIKKEEDQCLMLVPDYGNEKQRLDADNFGFLPTFNIGKKDKNLNGIKLSPEDNEWLFEVEYEEGATENLGLGKMMIIKALDSEGMLDLNLRIQQVSIDGELKLPFQWF